MDYALRVPPTANAGLVRIALRNNGAKLHHAQLFKLAEGKRLGDLYGEIMKVGGIAKLPAWASPAGGPSAALPGARIEVEQQLTPGRYAVICWIPAPDGQAHFAKGMIAEFDVRGPAVPLTAPRFDLRATVREYFVDLSAAPTRGMKRLHIRNTDTQAHEFLLVRLAPGKQVRDVAAWSEHGQVTAPPPAELWRGVGALAPGGEAWLEVNFTPGRYAIFCLSPDTADGRPHLQHGLVHEFTVR